MSARRQLSNLAQLDGRLAELRRELLMAREQVSIQSELTSDAGLKMLVADTPQASVAYRRANTALARARGDLDEAELESDALTRERNDLLRRIPVPISSRS